MALRLAPGYANLNMGYQIKKQDNTQPMDWKKQFNQAIELPGKFLANGGHAQQDIPAQHRLLNASMMFGGWWALDQVRQVVFGLRMKSEGEYVEVPIEEVPAPLKFLHKSIQWDPHSETPDNQWKKLAYQLIPGAGAGIGAVAGSMYAFERNGRAQQYKATKTQKALSLLDADFAAQYSQSTSLRALSAFFGTFSAASGLTYLYGMFLNNAFAASNGAKIFSGSLAHGNLAPHRAAEAQMGMLESYVKAGKSDAWAKQFVDRVMEPMFGHELNTPESQANAVKLLQGKAAQYLSEYKASKATPEAKAKQFGNKLATDLASMLHLDPKDARLGNANPIVWHFQNFLSSIGLAKPVAMAAPKNPARSFGPLPALGAGAAVATGLVALNMGSTASAAETTHSSSSSPSLSLHSMELKHARPNADGKTPAEYVYEAMALHNAQYKGTPPPALLKWMGDAQLAVLPTNRIDCAIGLTAGLMLAGNMAKIATGFGLDGKPVEGGKVPTYLKWMQGAVKDYNPKGLRPRDRWIKYAQWGVYSLGGMLGVKLGTDFAYRNVKNKNANPEYLEDYLPRVSMHQGETWSWLAAFSGIFGSASGLFALPIPGLNYAVGLASRATSMQDRNFMVGGLNGMMSGATTTSFLRLREGVNYLCHYAVENPAETPAQLEFLAYTMLGPIFKDQVTIEHIQRFTDAVHEVRDRYWQEGGIPKEKRKEALKTMREVFTGAGLEVLLMGMGLNPGAIAFNKLNGLTGTIGNVGITDKIKIEQDAYQHALEGRLPTYVQEGMISAECATWVKAGMEDMRHGRIPPSFTPGAQPCAEPANPSKTTEPQKTFAEKETRKNSIEGLIQRSEKPDDWRDAAKLRREHHAPAALGG